MATDGAPIRSAQGPPSAALHNNEIQLILVLDGPQRPEGG